MRGFLFILISVGVIASQTSFAETGKMSWEADYDPYSTEEAKETCLEIEQFHPDTLSYTRHCITDGTNIDQSYVFMENWRADPFSQTVDNYNPFGLNGDLSPDSGAGKDDSQYWGYPIMRGTMR